ncbi:hypothetical protein Fot_22671 [Forsythia ovata]|uniref:Uncharacterized protein n=1 Tax=Forsythia ovata TaxID=205694 RepID=A0ABD1UYD6_9LAMI
MGENNSAFVDFEFWLEDLVTMLPADKLFSDGKLMPLQRSSIQKSMRSVTTTSAVRSPDTSKLLMRNEISLTDPYLFSSKAPRCSSRCKELLCLKNSTRTAMRSKKIKKQPHHPIITIVKMSPKA